MKAWQPQEVERLRRLAARGLSRGQIGLALGRSRSAVSGKLHREVASRQGQARRIDAALAREGRAP